MVCTFKNQINLGTVVLKNHGCSVKPVSVISNLKHFFEFWSAKFILEKMYLSVAKKYIWKGNSASKL